MSILDRLFGRGGRASGSAADDSSATYYFLKCDKCGEIVRVRVDRRWDVEQRFEGSGDGTSGYGCSKEVIGKSCFKMMKLSVEFDLQYHETSRELRGGTFVTREDYEQAHSAS